MIKCGLAVYVYQLLWTAFKHKLWFLRENGFQKPLLSAVWCYLWRACVVRLPWPLPAALSQLRAPWRLAVFSWALCLTRVTSQFSANGIQLLFLPGFCGTYSVPSHPSLPFAWVTPFLILLLCSEHLLTEFTTDLKLILIVYLLLSSNDDTTLYSII